MLNEKKLTEKFTKEELDIFLETFKNDSEGSIIIQFKLLLANLTFNLKTIDRLNLDRLEGGLKQKIDFILNEEEFSEKKEIIVIKKEIDGILNSDKVKSFLKKKRIKKENIENQDPKELLKKYNYGEKVSNLELSMIISYFSCKTDFTSFFENHNGRLKRILLQKNKIDFDKILNEIEKKYKEFGFDDLIEEKNMKLGINTILYLIKNIKYKINR